MVNYLLKFKFVIFIFYTNTKIIVCLPLKFGEILKILNFLQIFRFYLNILINILLIIFNDLFIKNSFIL
jgi:hypothetical protein